MRNTNQLVHRRGGFTLVELIVVIGIILVIAALGAAFAPNVSDSQNMTRAVDNLEQWLLTAKMRAKRDGLATGIRFIPDPNNPTSGLYSEFQNIQQPEPLTGGNLVFVATGTNQPTGAVLFQQLGPIGNLFVTGGVCTLATALPSGLVQVQFANVDFTGGHALPPQYLVQPGDYLELRDGGVYLISQVQPSPPAPGTILQLAGTSYDKTITVPSPTTNYRILRQPRILIGEPPLTLPNNMVVDMNTIPGTLVSSNVVQGTSGYYEILFSPSGAVVGTNAGSGKLLIYVHDSTDLSQDITNHAGLVGVQCRTGFIGAYSVAPGNDPFYYAEEGRSSGL